jgi:hypothetical protein
MRSFESKLIDFEHYFGDLGGAIHFGNLTVTSGSGQISIRTLTADHVQLQNVDGLIEGRFDIKRSISLHTEIGAIHGEINLHPRGNRGNHEASMHLHSTHGNVSAVIGLSSSSLSLPSFATTAESETGTIVLEFLDSPQFAALNISASTEGPLAVVALPTTFQGEYLLHSSADTSHIWSRSLTGATLSDGWLSYIGSIVSWLVAEPHPFSTLEDDKSSDRDNQAARLHQTLSVVVLQNGSLSQGQLYWHPLDPHKPQSAAWIKGQNVLMIT